MLVKSDRMKLVVAHVPPARHDSAGQDSRNHRSPDKRLHVFRRDEVLLGLREDVRQVGKRAYKVGAAACWRTRSE